MSFTFKRTENIAATVSVELPTDDPRKPNKGSFVCKYKNLTREQMTALQEDLKARDLTDEQFLDAYLVSVSGIGGADGELTADQQRKLIYAEPALTLAVVSAFFPALMGAKAKN